MLKLCFNLIPQKGKSFLCVYDVPLIVRFSEGLLNYSILIVICPKCIRYSHVRNQNSLFPSMVTKTGVTLKVATAPLRPSATMV